MPESTAYVVVLTTLPADADALGLARALVDERLAACVNVVGPMRSVYRWEGQVQQDPERQLLIKTTRDRVAMLRERLGQLHPYEIPEFIVLPIVDGSDAYLRWIGEMTGERA